MFDESWDRAAPGGSAEIRVYVSDTDAMGVVYNSNYLTWFEIGRTELLRDRGLTYAEVERRGHSLPVTEAALRIRRSARYDDLLRIETRVGELRTRRIRFLYRIYRGQELLVEGETVHVPVRHADRKVVSFPDWLLGAVSATPGS